LSDPAAPASDVDDFIGWHANYAAVEDLNSHGAADIHIRMRRRVAADMEDE
jgi:hypothetical protein